MRYSALALVALASFPACSFGSDPTAPASRSASAALVALPSCQDVEDAVREAAVREMAARLDQRLAQVLHQSAYCQNNAGFGGGVTADAGAAVPGSGYGGSGGGASTGEETNTGDDSKGANQASGTNNQVIGVDEADFVKNDNKYIYVVSNGKLHIVDAWPATAANTLATLPVEGTPSSMFVTGDRVLIYSSIPKDPKDPYYQGGYYQPCTYGYECDFAGDGNPTLISIFDISDKTAPKKLRELRTTGSLVNSRRIGNAVHTVITTPGFRFPGVAEYPPGLDSCASSDEIWAAFSKLKAANAKAIRRTPISAQFPSVSDTRFSSGTPQTTTNLMAECSGFYAPSTADGSAFMTVLSFDMAVDAAPATTTIVSRPGAIYASADALYVSVPQSRSDSYGWYDGMGGADEASTVHKFGLANEQPHTTYVASGVVKGRVLNQFSMDDHDGYLRIATTNGHVPDPNVHSTLTVLAPQGSELIKVGQVDNIAPKEDIRSVRFDGDRGFIVTFKKTDPLFVLDLADPRTPAIVGELKIPGFSTYMHMMDASHLLTIGYDADDQGDFAWFAGVRLQIFDVTNMADPKLLHYNVIGTRGSSSEALANHLAFNYFAPKNLLALPMTICEGGTGGSFGANMTFNGLMVFEVTLQNGFVEKGRVSHPNDSSGTGYDSGVCSNWWTNASTEVKRSVIMDDFVYSISLNRMKINNVESLSTDVGELSLK
ncbi:MAG: beta-propeller domain-containing protein [Deltaproteobacteria bacterium]|nr:beta-propeller domain-containing protein [Deltaproteobacteria bacterium]